MATPPRAFDLGSSRVLLTGATGFVGQAVLERLLSDHPGVHVVALVRPRGTLTGRDRLQRLAHRPVFRRWRDEVGAAAVTAALATRCEVLEGSVDSLADLDPLHPALADLDVVIHSACEVTFTGPVDVAFATNVQGTATLCEALRAAGSTAHLVHISTAYVAGERRGPVPEASLDHQVGWREEVAAATAARERVEAASRTPEVLRTLVAEARRRHARTGPQAVARDGEALRAAWVADELVRLGRVRARSLGWADAYSHSKAMAERVVEELWAGDGRALTVLRPSVVESALRHPHPGWIDGYKTADPLIIAYGRGQLPQFPGLPDSVLDVVPVDFVVNAVVAAAAHPPGPTGPSYLHVVTGAGNPLPLHALDAELRRWFGRHPLAGEAGDVTPPVWTFPGGQRLERSTARSRRALSAAAWLLERGPVPGAAAALDGAQRAAAKLELLRAYNDVYTPYVQTEGVFCDARATALQDALGLLPGDPRAFRARDVDWHHYLHGVHLPAITAATRAGERRPTVARPRGTAPAPLPQGVAVVSLEALVPRRALLAAQAALVLAALPPERRAGAVARWAAGLADPAGADPARQTRAVLRQLRGVPAEVLAAAAGAPGAGGALVRRATPSLLAALAHHRAAGHRTVLVASVAEALLLPWAHDFDEVHGTALHVEDGVLTGYVGSTPLAGEALAAWLLHGRAQDGGDRVHVASVYGYGSAAHDTAWLSVVGQPVAVRPDRALRRLAEQRRWPVLEQGSSVAAWADLEPAGQLTGQPAGEASGHLDAAAAAHPNVIDLREARARVRLPHQAVREGSSRLTDQV